MLRDVPLVLFSKSARNSHLEALADTGCAALGLDWTISLGENARTRRLAWRCRATSTGVLLASPAAIRAAVKKALDSSGPRRATFSTSATASRRT